MFKTVGFLSLITLFTNILGFVRELLIARNLGTSNEADAFFSAFSIVAACFLIFSASTVQSALGPVYQGLVENGDEKKARGLIQVVSSVFIALMCVLGYLVYYNSHWLVALVLIGFDEIGVSTTSYYVEILAPMIPLIAAGVVFQTVLHSYKAFLLPGLIPFLNNVVIIFFLAYLVPVKGMDYLAYSFVFGAGLWLLLIPFLKKKVFFGTKRIIDKCTLTEVVVCLWPLLLLLFVDQVGGLFQKTFVSDLQAGSISALSYAAKLEGLPIGIISMAIAAVFFPSLISSINAKNIKKTTETLEIGVKLIVIVFIPITLYTCFLSEELVRVFFERGVFDVSSTMLTSDALFYYSLGMTAQALVIYLNRFFFAKKDTKTPMIIGSLAAIIHIFLCWELVKKFGYLGVAIGTSAYAWLYVVGLFVMVRKHISLKLKELFFMVFRVSVSVSPMYLLMLLPAGLHDILVLLIALLCLFTGGLYLFYKGDLGFIRKNI